MEDLGVLEFAAQFRGDRADYGFVDLGEPRVGGQDVLTGVGFGSPRTDGAGPGCRVLGRRVLVEIVEQPARLILADVESDQTQEAAGVVAGIHHLRLDADHTLRGPPQVQFRDVESERVEALHPAGDAPPFGPLHMLDGSQLVPEALVPQGDLVGDGDGVEVG